MSRVFVVFFLIIANTTCFSQNYAQLASHYAPIHVQKTCKKGHNSLNGKSDYLAAYNFDGDWDATNNWENLETYEIKPVVYYAVIESKSHYFITYAYFHPRDWTRTHFTKIGQHENDLEGALLIVEKNTTNFGILKGVITVFHHQLIHTSITLNDGNQDDYKLVTYQQAKGHGCKAINDIVRNKKYTLYFPPEVIFHKNKLGNQYVEKYELIDLFAPNELWSQRDNSMFFEKDQTIKGNNGKGANPPWLWQSKKWKSKLPQGTLAKYPSSVLQLLNNEVIKLDSNYLYNPYLGIY